MFSQLKALTDCSELTVKIVNTQDMERIMYLQEHHRASKHVSFDPSGTLLTVSHTDGAIHVYSLVTEKPELVKKIEGLVKSLESESESSSRVAWHPDGRAFGAPTGTRGEENTIRSITTIP
jgi:chromosome transmission fidelity protein 4